LSTIDGLELRKRLDRKIWGVPETWGPDGWRIDTIRGPHGRIIVTADAPKPEFEGWIHASISRKDEVPSYDDLVMLHKAVWPNGYAYQAFVPPSMHVNIHPYALHLWGRHDGAAVLPEFGKYGTI